MQSVLFSSKKPTYFVTGPEVAELKEHNAQKVLQFRRIREVRCIVNDPSNKAVAIRMD